MMAEKTILDVCCGSRMFWFDRDDDRVIFCDKRAERHVLNDKTAKGGQRDLVIEPNVISDFTAFVISALILWRAWHHLNKKSDDN